MALHSVTAPGHASQMHNVAQIPDVLMRCPRCRIGMHGMGCPSCGFRFRIRDGIFDALLPERAAHYRRFIDEYERIRRAEGRGDSSREFYLALPFRDLSRRNSEQWRIRARTYEYLIRTLMREHRADKPGRIQGRVLDIGAGNCWMSYRLALAGFSPYAVDLLTNELDGLGSARNYEECLPELFPRFRAEMARLPFQSEQFDVAIFNASFHYAESYEAVLSEALRCVRRRGLVVISDTAWYSREESGQRMVRERREAFRGRYGTASDSIESLEYLTDARLRSLERRFSIRWQIDSPWYGFRWAMRPLWARLRNRREPSRFRIYAARKER
jgi:SAM-dependent methyltransferase